MSSSPYACCLGGMAPFSLRSLTSHVLLQQGRQLPRREGRSFASTARNAVDFTHVVIGGGAVGLAIARQLAFREGTSTLLIERHGMVGSETSSRNSEVIHAGLYYGHDTLKTKLCLKGKHMMYELCEQKNIPYRNTGKWIIAQDEQQMAELDKVHKFASSIDVPTQFLTRSEIAHREPDVRAEAGVLESTSTGIVDSHAFMSFLEGDFLDKGGDQVLHTTVTHIERKSLMGTGSSNAGSDSGGSYLIHTKSSDGTENEVIETETLINSAGLGAIAINNMVLPQESHRKPFYAKGSYFSYGSSRPKPKTLLYPAPVPGLGGLGTHLTLDMSGRIRFGPDVEWVDNPTDLSPNPTRLSEAIDMIQTYLPSIDRTQIDLDYCGIRPKLGRTSGTAGPNFADFYIEHEKAAGCHGFVNLLGIESPGLTSSLAIADYVDRILYGDVV